MRLRITVHGRWGWVPLLAGVLAAMLAWAVLLAAGVAAGLWWISWDGGVRAVVDAALWWIGFSVWLALVIGGWTAARLLDGNRRDAAVAGGLVGLIVFVLVCLLFAVMGDAVADLRSVKVELGLIEIPENATIVEPVSDQFEDPTIRTPDDVRETVISAAVTLAILIPLLLGAAVLGGLIGLQPESGARGHADLLGAIPDEPSGPDMSRGIDGPANPSLDTTTG